MQDYDAYIFDLDGTLIDSLGDLAYSCNYALRHCQMSEKTIDEVRMMVGNGVRKLMERAVPGGEDNPRFEEALSVFRQHYLTHNLDATVPYPGIVEMLARLRGEGKKLAVVSNKFDKATKALVAHFFKEYIDVAIGEKDGIRRKPAPDTVVEAMRQLNVEKERTVYIGDSDVDIQTARNTGVSCISVLWGFRDKEFLLAHGATDFADSPDQIVCCSM